MNILVPKIEKLANFGTAESWVARIWLGIPELIELLNLPEAEKNKIKDAVNDIAEELSAAFIALGKLKSLEASKEKTVLEIKKEYSDLYDHLWRAYKDRFQTACSTLGYNIGFLFKEDRDFERESIEFLKNYPKIPDSFRKMLKIDRRIWQNGLSDFRNLYIQHRMIGREIEKLYYKISITETTFANVWGTIEDSIVTLIQTKLEEPLKIIEIPQSERDPACPKRFRITILN